MERIIIRHLKGSKASQVEEFPLAQFAELTLGRDPNSQVKFEPEKDDIVGRRHARIAKDGDDASKFTLIDLSSRNGTFVNRSRVFGSMPLNSGDIIQLGAGGPEIEFELDFRSPTQANATTLAPDVEYAEPTGRAKVGAAATASSGGVGKAKIEPTIGEPKVDGSRNLLLIRPVIIVLAALGAAWFAHGC